MRPAAPCTYYQHVPERGFSDNRIEAALEALTEPERFRQAEIRVARHAPHLQRVLLHALKEGGWLEAHEAEVLKAATTPDEDERIAAIRMLLAEETRMGMLVGVAVGWELAYELEGATDEPAIDHDDEEDR